MKHTDGEIEYVRLATLPAKDGYDVTYVDALVCNTVSDFGQLKIKSTEHFVEKHVIDLKRIKALWNASDGMTNDEAVRYLEHGAEMVALIRAIGYNRIAPDDIDGACQALDALMEGK